MVNPAVTYVDPLVPTIFHEPWWLDTATGGQYAVAEVEEQGRAVGRFLYYIQKKWAGPVVDLPPLPHFLGAAVVDCEGSPTNGFYVVKEVTKQLVSKLPKTSSFYVKCHRDVRDVLAFQECGFGAKVQFTHEVHPQSLDIIWKNMLDKARNIIRATHYLLTSRHHMAHSGSSALLAWDAIKEAVEPTLIFDFDGCVNEGAVRAASSFRHVTSRYGSLRLCAFSAP
jgi:hypothetical protein